VLLVPYRQEHPALVVGLLTLRDATISGWRSRASFATSSWRDRRSPVTSGRERVRRRSVAFSRAAAWVTKVQIRLRSAAITTTMLPGPAERTRLFFTENWPIL